MGFLAGFRRRRSARGLTSEGAAPRDIGRAVEGGQEQHATRLEDDGESEEAWEPTPEDLRGFSGRYFSEEIETFFTVDFEDPAEEASGATAGSDQAADVGDSRGQGGEPHLVLRHRRLEDAQLSPGDRDTFSGGGLTLSFERDRNGTILGFYLSNTRTRDVRFERIR